MTCPRIGIIGAGKVGCALARLLFEAGYHVSAVYSRSADSARTLAALVQAVPAAPMREVVKQSDLVLLTVPDDVIEAVAVEIVQSEGDMTGRSFVHTSGVHDAGVLWPLAERGALTGSLHPALPFADCERAMRSLNGAAFAVEAEAAQLRDWLHDVVSTLGGHVLDIPPGGKVLYHTALVLVSNYTVALYGAAESLLLSLGAEREAADRALNMLLAATADNLKEQGIPQALTGPLVRGDVQTVAAHLQALRQNDHQLAATYTELARLALPLVAARGISTEALERLLGE